MHHGYYTRRIVLQPRFAHRGARDVDKWVGFVDYSACSMREVTVRTRVQAALADRELRTRLSIELRELVGSRRGAQADLARHTGVSSANVSRWLTGHAMPPLEWIVQVADLYEVSVDSLLGREKPPDPVYEFVANFRDAFMATPMTRMGRFGADAVIADEDGNIVEVEHKTIREKVLGARAAQEVLRSRPEPAPDSADDPPRKRKTRAEQVSK